MTKKQLLAQQLLSGLLFIAVLIALGWLSVRYKTDLDWTAGHRNSLSAATAKLLKAMPDPISFTAFIPSGDADIRTSVQYDLARYQRLKPNVTLSFVDPSKDPKQARDLNITAVGQVVVEYDGRHEILTATTEPVVSTTLQRLAYSGEKWVEFIEGHGERSIINNDDSAAISKFAGVLRDKGLKVAALNLARTPKIPDNTSVLVLASPAKAMLPGEVTLIKDYVDHGGNLLWLADPDYPAGAEPLAKDLGIDWQNGYAIFPDYRIVGTGNPGFYAATDYPPNPVTQGMDEVTLFPLVRSLTADTHSGWTAQPLLKTNEMSWLATGDISKGVTGKKPGDISGPLTIGMTLTREYKDPNDKDKDAKPVTQRVALIGDADFISNQFLATLGNQQLGVNLIQWLASRDAQLNIDIPKAPDTSLYIPGWGLVMIAGGFVLVLPLLLISFGVGRWTVRRRR